MSLSDRDPDMLLISGVAQKDEAAFAQLFRRYQHRLQAFFWQRCRDRHAAEELVQETMIVVWQRADTFNGSSRASSWILGIGYRKYREWQRHRRQTREFAQHGVDPVVDDFAPAGGRDLVGQELGRESLTLQVRQALRKLSEDHRLVIDLVFQQGLSYEEIARILGVSSGTVKSRMFYARQRLKEVLVSQGMKGDELWKIARSG